MIDLEIAVAGGGIGGMAAALALAQRGARVTLYERADTLREVGAGLQLGPNATAVLDALGVIDAAAKLATRPEAIEIQNHHGTALMSVPLGTAAEARWGHPFFHMHRADLLGVLTDAALHAGVTLRLGSEVTGFKADPATLVMGDASVEADVVIGADGVRSTLRSQMWEGEKVRFTGQVAWRGIVQADRLATPPRPVTRLVMGPGRHIVLYRLRGGREVNFVAVQERETWAEEGWSHRDDPDNLRAAFADFPVDVRDTLAACDETFLWGLFAHPELAHWHDGGMVLTGDACHPMLPFLAQGAGMALEDAWVLADCLDRAAAPSDGIAAFERRRHDRATRVQREAEGQAWLYHLAGPTRPFVHLGMRAISVARPDFGARKYDWLYGHDVTAA